MPALPLNEGQGVLNRAQQIVTTVASNIISSVRSVGSALNSSIASFIEDEGNPERLSSIDESEREQLGKVGAFPSGDRETPISF